MGQLDNWVPGAKRPVMIPKYKHYHPIGDGRDYFMSFKQDTPMKAGKSQETKSNRFDRYGSFTRSLNLPNIRKAPSPVNYANDGKGGDGYIRVDNGGFLKSSDPLTSHFFKKTLRSFSNEVPS